MKTFIPTSKESNANNAPSRGAKSSALTSNASKAGPLTFFVCVVVFVVSLMGSSAAGSCTASTVVSRRTGVSSRDGFASARSGSHCASPILDDDCGTVARLSGRGARRRTASTACHSGKGERHLERLSQRPEASEIPAAGQLELRRGAAQGIPKGS